MAKIRNYITTGMKKILVDVIPVLGTKISFNITEPGDANFSSPPNERFIRKNELTPAYWNQYRSRREVERTKVKTDFMTEHPNAVIEESEHLILFRERGVTTLQATEFGYLCDGCIDRVIDALN